MSRSLRVAIPIAGFNRSGGVKTLVLLAGAMAERGWHVRLLVPDYSSDPPFALAPGIDIVRIDTATGRRGVRMLRFYMKLARMVAHDTDVCVANFYLTAHAAYLGRLANRRLRVIYFLQGDE